ncbi:MAG: transcriptional repressor [Polyangiaceae bacterium]
MTVPYVAHALRNHGIQPSAQRVAVATFVLDTDEHPSADDVWARVKTSFPMISRATVYNTLNLFVRQGLLKECALAEGRTVFDPNLAPHHHFIDDATGRIHDIPWDALTVEGVESLTGHAVREFQVVLRGKKKKPR